MTATMTVETSRVYIKTPFGHPLVERLKKLGAHWDRDRKQWWIGKAKRAAVEELIASDANVDQSPDAPRAAEDADDIKVVAKARYNGKTYYVQWMGRTSRGTDAARLRSLDGKLDFWKDLSEIEIVKRYEPREERGSYGRPTGRVIHQTLGGLRRFIERSREAERQIAAGEIPDGYAIDREDGLVKRIGECDMPDRD